MQVGPVAVGMGSPCIVFAELDGIALVPEVGSAFAPKMKSENARKLK